MRNLALVIVALFTALSLKAQVTTDPNPPYDNQSVTITFDAAGVTRG